MATVKISIATNSDLMAELEKLVVSKDRTRNWLVNKAIEEYIINHKREV